jgi:chaperonin GroES
MPRASQPADPVDPAAPKPATGSRSRSAKPRKARGTRGPQIRLTADRLVVRVPEDGERKSAGGLLIPATAMPAPKRLAWGDVTLVGPDVRVANPGDRVLFLPSSGLEVELDGDELVLLRERDVQAVATPPDSKTDRSPGQYL